ncbi:MAG: twin-arginine translocase subunit TatC [Puniceicoccales bacterium]|jgi:Tat protein translocase TatC|nr:twin-arginine translocase subunit TatC [Puniceicoccales bacterium]
MFRFLTIGLGHLLRSLHSRGSTDGQGKHGNAKAENEMGFFEHLEELRSMLLRCIGAFAIAMVAAVYWSKDIFALMRRPLRRAIEESPEILAAAQEANAKAADPLVLLDVLGSIFLKGEIPPSPVTTASADAAALVSTATGDAMVAMKFMDPFSILLNIAMVGGIALASGPILYFASCFVAPALTPKEKKCIIPFCLSSMLLFIAGVLFSFFFLIPVSIQVMFQFAHMFGLRMTWLAADYYSFVTTMLLLVGLSFQFPLVVIILQYLEIVRTQTLFKYWRHVLVGIFVASLVISPLGDPATLSVLTGMLFLLYIGAASIGGILTRAKQKKRLAEEIEYERTYGKPKNDTLPDESNDNPDESPYPENDEDNYNNYDGENEDYGTDDGSGSDTEESAPSDATENSADNNASNDAPEKTTTSPAPQPPAAQGDLNLVE